MFHIIINPASCSGKGLTLWTETVEPALRRQSIAYRPYFSEKAGDVARIASEITTDILPGEKLRLIILGGDGTVNECLQGLENPSDVIIGYIPTGSSNDLARDLKIPKDPEAALNLILHTGKVHDMDMGTVFYPDGETRRFAVGCGIGFDAAVCEESVHSRIKVALNKIGLGKLTYIGIALKQLISARKTSCEISLDDNPPFQIRNLFCAVSMNHRYQGGGIKFCPDADANDGIMNLCVIGDVPKLVILFALPTAYIGKHFMFRGVNPYRAKKVHLKTKAPLWVQTDGEVTRQTTEFTVQCRQSMLHIIY